ncbi:hypothetical protein Tco_0719619 [Tanacetum coccineum]
MVVRVGVWISRVLVVISSVISLDIIRFMRFTHRREFSIEFCDECFEYPEQNSLIGMDVASTSINNGFWFEAHMRIIREIKFEKDFVLEDFERFVQSIAEEDSSGSKIP